MDVQSTPAKPIEEDDGVDLEVVPNFYGTLNTSIIINRTSPILNTLYEELADLHSKVNKNNKYGFKLFALTKRFESLKNVLEKLKTERKTKMTQRKKSKNEIMKKLEIRNFLTDFQEPQNNFLNNMIEEMKTQYDEIPEGEVFEHSEQIRKFEEKKRKLKVKKTLIEGLDKRMDKYIELKKDIRKINQRILNKNNELEQCTTEANELKEAQQEQKQIKDRIEAVKGIITQLKNANVETFRPFNGETLKPLARTFLKQSGVTPDLLSITTSVNSLKLNDIANDNVTQQQSIIADARKIVQDTTLDEPSNNDDDIIVAAKKRIKNWIGKAKEWIMKPIKGRGFVTIRF